MSRTPDYFPGDREEEGLLILSGSEFPSKNGEIRYVTGSGFWFNDEGILKQLSSPSSSSITSGQHRTLRQLIHFIDDGPGPGFTSGLFKETLPAGNPFPTLEIWWESSAKLKKVVQLELTRSIAQMPVTESWKMFDVDGSTIVETASDSITYTGIFETTRTRTLT